MDATEIRQALEEFVEESIRDNSGLLPDATLNMEWASGGRGFLIGPIGEGESEPQGGIRTRVVDLQLKFASITSRRKVGEAISRLTTALMRDAHLGGRIRDGDVRLRACDVQDDHAGDWQATVTVAVATFE